MNKNRPSSFIFIKRSIDSTVINLLQKQNIAVPLVPDITQTFFEDAGGISSQFGFGVSIMRDLVLTPTNTSFFTHTHARTHIYIPGKLGTGLFFLANHLDYLKLACGFTVSCYSVIRLAFL